MLFCTPEFMVFFVALFAAYWALPWRRGRVWLLLAASFYFYACWNKWLALLICLSTFVDWCLALALERLPDGRRRRLLLCLSLTANLGLLAYFKYTNFFLASLYDGLGWPHEPGKPILDILLPVGISFYTFEAINYMVDVYRRRIPAERNLADFLLFILFFPHLVAGPIVRAKDFLPQIKRPKQLDWVRVHLGLQYFLLGLFKKLAIADRMALFADPVFKQPLDYRTPAAWIAMFAYALQVYADFSGYTDMALGAAHMLGYKLAKNFDLPYLSANIAEFWNRWHMSLSSWLRDYIFVPLGGSQEGEAKAARNLLITFTLCGLWHGAQWTFVGFGFLQGLMLITHRAFRRRCRRWPGLERLLQSSPGTVLRVVFTFVCFCLSLVIFRAGSFGQALAFYQRLLTPGGSAAAPAPVPEIGFWLTAALVLACHLLARRGAWVGPARRIPAPALGLAYAGLLAVSFLLAPQATNPFIYFQF
jgi:alginate O-acetyltransferase complex protein AlgI